MYRIIGGDGNEYGPITAEQVRQWIAEGRANRDTKVRAGESPEWRTIADFPEFARSFPSATPPPLPGGPKTSGMAVSSFVLAILGPFTCGLTAFIGLLLGIIAMVRISRSKGRLRGQGLAIAACVLSGVVVMIAPLLAAIAIPSVIKARGQAMEAGCVNNLRHLSLALRVHADGNNEQFPNGDTWCDAAGSASNVENSFKCGLDKSGERCSYAYNSKLSGVNVAQVDPGTVLLFESRGGWNESGGPELALLSARHSGQRIAVAFADGSVRQVAVSEIGELRWDP